MSRPKSVYLTAATMQAVRQFDSLSGRLNQIVDRYSQILAEQSSDNLANIAEIAAPAYAPNVSLTQCRADMASALVAADKAFAAQWVRDMRLAKFAALVEMIEQIQPPPTHSQAAP